MKKPLLSVFKWIGIILGIVVGILLIFVIVASITEFRPKQTEKIEIIGTAKNQTGDTKTFKIMTWNIGYAALGDNADFFMDGGKMVNTATKERVQQNLASIIQNIQAENPDFFFVQEIDPKSTRTHFINEEDYFATNFADYQHSFATNYKVLYLPYPVYEPMGVLHSGIACFSKYPVSSATREQLPVPFKWPVRMLSIKRCALINRIAIKDTNKELVLINFHLEAFDDGEGKIAQTKMLTKLFAEEMNKGNYVIAGGDFNQVFNAEDFEKYPTLDPNYWRPGTLDTSELDSSVQLVHDISEPTCRSLDKAYTDDVKANFQFYVIDGYWVSPNITVKSIKTKNLDFKWTDHNPVVMTFELN